MCRIIKYFCINMNQLKLSGSYNYRFLNLCWTSVRSDPRLADQPEVAGSGEVWPDQPDQPDQPEA